MKKILISLIFILCLFTLATQTFAESYSTTGVCGIPTLSSQTTSCESYDSWIKSNPNFCGAICKASYENCILQNSETPESCYFKAVICPSNNKTCAQSFSNLSQPANPNGNQTSTSTTVHVSGSLTCDNGSPEPSQTVNIWTITTAGSVKKVGQQDTDSSGHYSIDFTVDVNSLPLTVRVGPNDLTFNGDPPTEQSGSNPNYREIVIDANGGTEQSLKDINFSYSRCDNTHIDSVSNNEITINPDFTADYTIKGSGFVARAEPLFVDIADSTGKRYFYGDKSNIASLSDDEIVEHGKVNTGDSSYSIPPGTTQAYLTLTNKDYTSKDYYKISDNSIPVTIHNNTNHIPRYDVANLEFVISLPNHCSNNQTCIDTVKKLCFSGNGIDTTNSDQSGNDNVIYDSNLDKNNNGSTAGALTAAAACITNQDYSNFSTDSQSGLTKTSAGSNSGKTVSAAYLVYPVGKNLGNATAQQKIYGSNANTTFTIPGALPQPDCSQGSYTYHMDLLVFHQGDNGNLPPTSGIYHYNLTYNCSSGNTGGAASTGSGAAGTTGGAASQTGSAGTSTTSTCKYGNYNVDSCTGRCATAGCVHGDEEATIKWCGTGDTQGVCIPQNQCPSGQNTCSDTNTTLNNVGATTPGGQGGSCTYSQSCGNGGTQTCPGKYVGSQCMYAGGQCESCVGQVGSPNRVCAPGSYSSEDFIQCDGSQALVHVKQCNSDGTAWGDYGNPYHQPNMAGRCGGNSANEGSSCSYPESCPSCPGGVHTCTGTIQGGSCKYDSSVAPNCH